MEQIEEFGEAKCFEAEYGPPPERHKNEAIGLKQVELPKLLGARGFQVSEHFNVGITAQTLP